MHFYPLMLPKTKRLTSQEVRTVLKEGKSVRIGTVSARYTKARDPKAALVVSTKVAKSAVTRNRLRRLGYQALTLPQGLHMVVFIHSKEVTPEDITALCSKLSS